MSEHLLDVSGLTLDLKVGRDYKPIILGTSWWVDRGEALALVGESGSGKSLSARSVIRLLPPTARLGGDVVFDGVSMLSVPPAQLRAIRASRIAMIFQDPRAYINPIHTVADFLCEGLVRTRGVSRSDARRLAVDRLHDVGIRDADRRLQQLPHELSGGLLQRVMIAAALMAEPTLLLADEPTTALDVTTQEEVMAILDDLRTERGLAMVFITHDLDLATAVCDRLVVMQAGRVVETLGAAEIYTAARDAYTRSLVEARAGFDLPDTNREGVR
ncbi:ABC transporter ATP-binding protein [Subtercola sp. YIM 133946]|uniref:ABC transporter ATP-binding protein n=1 Tax=Subtercola sp. YIM 133946 TaxID=3118909 RepID=UPI002F937BEE